VARILIAEHPPDTRAGIRSALERAGHEVCAECEDAGSAVQAADRTRPSVCLVDLDLPGGGIAAVRALASRRRPPRVLMLASRLRDADFFAGIRAGAQGFVLKDVDPRRLPLAVDSVLADGAALSPALTARLIEAFRALGVRA
jgi:DNA-binding NarL/FixJ family response regulator